MRIELGQTHAFPVKRVTELMRWVRSGEYDRIVDGEYARRGDPVDARAEAGDAVEFYAERFRAIFRDAGAGVEKAGEAVGAAAERAQRLAAQRPRLSGSAARGGGGVRVTPPPRDRHAGSARATGGRTIVENAPSRDRDPLALHAHPAAADAALEEHGDARRRAGSSCPSTRSARRRRGRERAERDPQARHDLDARSASDSIRARVASPGKTARTLAL